MAVVFLDARCVDSTCRFICFYFIACDGHALSILLYWVMTSAWCVRFTIGCLRRWSFSHKWICGSVSCFVICLFVVWLYSICFVLINLVISFRSECVTDSLIKQRFMSMQKHHSIWLNFFSLTIVCGLILDSTLYGSCLHQFSVFLCNLGSLVKV